LPPDSIEETNGRVNEYVPREDLIYERELPFDLISNLDDNNICESNHTTSSKILETVPAFVDTTITSECKNDDIPESPSPRMETNKTDTKTADTRASNNVPQSKSSPFLHHKERTVVYGPDRTTVLMGRGVLVQMKSGGDITPDTIWNTDVQPIVPTYW